MHKTFYIDIDEEITSVVERLRKARSEEVSLIVPKRALLIQSIVNLRLLKKEADNLGVSILVVTQDKLGKLLAEKAGISVGQKFDDLDNQEEETVEILESEPKEVELPELDNAHFQNEESGRLARIGSSEYFDENKTKKDNLEKKEPSFSEKGKTFAETKIPAESPERITNKELVTGLSTDIKEISKVRPTVDSMSREAKPVSPAKDVFLPAKSLPDSSGFSQREEKGPYHLENQKENSFYDKKIEKFFSTSSDRPVIDERKNEKNVQLDDSDDGHGSAIARKIAWGAGFIIITLGFLALGYFVLPKASVLIETEVKFKSQEDKIGGDAAISEIDYEKGIIPLKVVEISEEFTKKFPVSGSRTISNQKARGKITIYNEFSAAPQSLVSTTRFLSSDGKIFRLIKGVTVPGMKKEGEETIPGSVEADVAADEGGEDFNIGPEKFTIPGFKESASGKYEKIYAKSSSAMAGGGEGTASAKALSQDDIEKAKKETVAELPDFISEKISQKTGSGMKVLNNLVKKEEPVYKISNSQGEVVSNFEITLQFQAQVLAFSEEDVRKLAGKILAKSGSEKEEVSESSIILEYADSKADFEAKTAEIDIQAKGKASPKISPEEIRKGILGKTNAELEAYLANYPEMKKVEIVYWPPFLSSRIPLWEKRVSVEIQ